MHKEPGAQVPGSLLFSLDDRMDLFIKTYLILLRIKIRFCQQLNKKYAAGDAVHEQKCHDWGDDMGSEGKCFLKIPKQKDNKVYGGERDDGTGLPRIIQNKLFRFA